MKTQFSPLLNLKYNKPKNLMMYLRVSYRITVYDANIHAQNQTLQPHLNGPDASIQPPAGPLDAHEVENAVGQELSALQEAPQVPHWLLTTLQGSKLSAP